MKNDELQRIAARIEAVCAAGEWTDEDAAQAFEDRRQLVKEVRRLRDDLNAEYGHEGRDET